MLSNINIAEVNTKMTTDVRNTTKITEIDGSLDSVRDNPEIRITKILREIGMPAHVKGYYYVREAILLMLNSSDPYCPTTKVIYPTVAQMYTTTPSKVDRAIRNAIDLAWDHSDFDVLYRYFGYTVLGRRGRPTNCEFISMIADHVRLQMKK